MAAETVLFPHNVDAEQAVIGTLLLEPNLIAETADKLKPEHFYIAAHRLIFETMLEQSEDGKSIDFVTLGTDLTNHQAFKGKEVISYLTELANAVPTTATLPRHIERVQEEALRREMFRTGQQLMQQAKEYNKPAVEVLDKAEQHVLSLVQFTGDTEGPESLAEAAGRRWEYLYHTKDDPSVLGVKTGFVDVDNMLGGLQPAEFILLAARPSMGKTALSLQIAKNIAAAGKGAVLYFSLEMSKDMLVDRLICAEAGLDHVKIKNRTLTEKEWDRGSKAMTEISQLNLMIDDEVSTTAAMRSVARKVKRESGLALIVIDYLQLIADKPERAQNSQNDIVTAISRRLKAMAKSLQVPVMALSQLNRATEKRGDHRPMLSDLRDSGSLEQDADQAWFIHRPEYYNPKDSPGIAEIMIAKNRNGPVGVQELSFTKQFARFGNLAATGGTQDAARPKRRQSQSKRHGWRQE
ncbi:replicative DNA helicase [Numidum massiliense]|uniref:replicative DNA helicase n=1 Tax=Numidum massiliense TaxID=1522315 RepID=UPI0006D5995D|nr:replicative DNA helicase [Numidum massiliense]